MKRAHYRPGRGNDRLPGVEATTLPGTGAEDNFAQRNSRLIPPGPGGKEGQSGARNLLQSMVRFGVPTMAGNRRVKTRHDPCPSGVLVRDRELGGFASTSYGQSAGLLNA